MNDYLEEIKREAEKITDTIDHYVNQGHQESIHDIDINDLELHIVEAITRIAKQAEAKGRREAVEKMINETWECRNLDVKNDIVFVTHGDIISCGYKLLNTTNEDE